MVAVPLGIVPTGCVMVVVAVDMMVAGGWVITTAVVGLIGGAVVEAVIAIFCGSAGGTIVEEVASVSHDSSAGGSSG